MTGKPPDPARAGLRRMPRAGDQAMKRGRIAPVSLRVARTCLVGSALRTVSRRRK